jgi:hypothetical protein
MRNMAMGRNIAEERPDQGKWGGKDVSGVCNKKRKKEKKKKPEICYLI